ncbi:phosphoribosylglycinamide formyltransferase [Colletotrichum truncatum]|uniref:Phosphoribosylglycinamide formyltransferase n=1 Tax=Colletotrichum truncatum TaxID=5467 RepID=A0ACC3YPD5_COLTU|nr:phosphoribosylglycinamide formyltransferase [Colletotrichum truncatum]KAF6784223.1 phosphoribosylglycinamide formyltransferase [Colletotrichum truncatum]
MSDQQKPTCRILVMASGNGSNFQALIDAVASGRIPNSKIIRLIVNRKNAYAKTRAEQANIPWECFNMISNGFLAKGEKDEAKATEARQKYDAVLAEKVLAEKPDLVVLAGWMHVFTSPFLRPLESAGIKAINLHPALPGKFDGAGAIERAYEAFQAGQIEETGIMVHNVIEAVDQGKPIMTKTIPCQKGEALAQFEERIHSHEHELIVEATAKVVKEILGL